MEKIKITKTYVKDVHAEPIERKHIILLDGTWNDETGVLLDGNVTNIVRLSGIFIDDAKTQIVRYHRGVGNDDDNTWFWNKWRGLTGRGAKTIVEHAYARFVQDWQQGDRIYIFGFSRGAAEARLLAAKIQNLGIPSEITITIEPRANKETNVIEQVMTEIKTVPNTSSDNKVKIEFLGVWDTVSAFGLGNVLTRWIFGTRKDLFTDNNIAGNILRAVHLLAIDETRQPFVPSLMNQKEGVVHEVWFPGVHSDIGGSYPEDSIARVSLYYMLEQLRKWEEVRGIPLSNTDEDALTKYTSSTISNAYFHFHGLGRGENLRRIAVQENGKLLPASQAKPKVHRIYQDICKAQQAWSVLEKKDKEGKPKKIGFQYMPFNMKELDGEYEVTD